MAILLAFAVTGCPLQPRQTSSQVTESGKALGPPPDDLKPSVRVRQAIDDLHAGKQESARQQLGWVLMKNPKHRTARDLLGQLNADPIKRLGKESFSYTVQPGDTLSMIARMFLADPIKFVILGRYNSIENPGLLSVGQTLRIPGKQRAAKTAATTGAEKSKAIREKTQPQIEQQVGPKPTQVPGHPAVVKQSEEGLDREYKRAKELYDAGRFQKVIPSLETAMNVNPESAGIRKLLIDSYSAYAEQLIAGKKRLSARTLLENALRLDRSNEHLIARLSMIEAEIEADRLFFLASEQAEEGHLETAYQTYAQVLALSPNHVSALQGQNGVRVKLAEHYHRQGMQLFRQQKLDEAIANWEKVIEIDPGHNLAAGYRARALKLKSQFERLQDK